MQRQRADQPVAEVEQVHALVHQLAPARELTTSAPFVLVAEPPSVAVAGADEHDVAVRAGASLLHAARDPGMEPVVEAYLHDPAVLLRVALEGPGLLCRRGSRLLDEDVGTGRYGPAGQLG